CRSTNWPELSSAPPPPSACVMRHRAGFAGFLLQCGPGAPARAGRVVPSGPPASSISAFGAAPNNSLAGIIKRTSRRAGYLSDGTEEPPMNDVIDRVVALHR